MMKNIYIYLLKTLFCIILFLMLAILCRGNVYFRNFIHENIYSKHISFSYFKNFYNQYLGGIFPIETISDAQLAPVFDEKLVYHNLRSYSDGVALTVTDHYLVPTINGGIVVYLGIKEKYGNVAIIEGDNGINVWYGNLCNINVNLYDTLELGNYLGEVCDNTLYLVFTRKNNYLDYMEFLD